MRLAVWPVPPARALASALADLVTEVVEIEPHEARQALEEGGCEIALVPTLDVFRGPGGLDVVPGVVLAGERSPRRRLVVGSALDAIETIGFDPHDAQEALLTQLVLREHYGTQAQFAYSDPADPLADVLGRESAALVDYRDAVPEDAFVLDPGQEWVDLTLRPYPWALLVALEGTLDVVAAARLRAAARVAPITEALFHDGVGAYQLTFDGYVADGLDQLAEYLFATGTLPDMPAIPFMTVPEEGEDDTDDEA